MSTSSSQGLRNRLFFPTLPSPQTAAAAAPSSSVSKKGECQKLKDIKYALLIRKALETLQKFAARRNDPVTQEDLRKILNECVTLWQTKPIRKAYQAILPVIVSRLATLGGADFAEEWVAAWFQQDLTSYNLPAMEALLDEVRHMEGGRSRGAITGPGTRFVHLGQEIKKSKNLIWASLLAASNTARALAFFDSLHTESPPSFFYSIGPTRVVRSAATVQSTYANPVAQTGALLVAGAVNAAKTAASKVQNGAKALVSGAASLGSSIWGWLSPPSKTSPESGEASSSPEELGSDASSWSDGEGELDLGPSPSDALEKRGSQPSSPVQPASASAPHSSVIVRSGSSPSSLDAEVDTRSSTVTAPSDTYVGSTDSEEELEEEEEWDMGHSIEPGVLPLAVASTSSKASPPPASPPSSEEASGPAPVGAGDSSLSARRIAPIELHPQGQEGSMYMKVIPELESLVKNRRVLYFCYLDDRSGLELVEPGGVSALKGFAESHQENFRFVHFNLNKHTSLLKGGISSGNFEEAAGRFRQEIKESLAYARMPISDQRLDHILAKGKALLDRMIEGENASNADLSKVLAKAYLMFVCTCLRIDLQGEFQPDILIGACKDGIDRAGVMNLCDAYFRLLISGGAVDPELEERLFLQIQSACWMAKKQPLVDPWAEPLELLLNTLDQREHRGWIQDVFQELFPDRVEAPQFTRSPARYDNGSPAAHYDLNSREASLEAYKEILMHRWAIGTRQGRIQGTGSKEQDFINIRNLLEQTLKDELLPWNMSSKGTVELKKLEFVDSGQGTFSWSIELKLGPQGGSPEAFRLSGNTQIQAQPGGSLGVLLQMNDPEVLA